VTRGSRRHRGIGASACLVAFLCGFLPAHSDAAAVFDENARALSLLNASTCAQRMSRPAVVAQQSIFATPSPSPSPSPGPFATPFIWRPQNGPASLYATPVPRGQVTPPPIPTPSASPDLENQPVFLVRGGPTPPPITPAGSPAPPPTPAPTAAATLAPNDVAVLADKVDFNSQQGKPGDAYGNVHVLYSAGEVVGDHAHYDGKRTVTVTGHPFLVNRAHDSVLSADEIDFDIVDQSAKLKQGRGVSSEGLDRGLIHFTSPDLHTDPDGIGHGTQAWVSTCENPRGGYHMTGKTITYYPGDKIVITNAVLWLGAAAVFWLPRVIIPLRTVDDPRRQVKYFPEVGYDQFEGAYIKVALGFGKDQYYYGQYKVDYYTKVGLGLGYIAFFAKRNGRRTFNVNFYTIHDRRINQTQSNLSMQEQENFSKTLRGDFQFTYNGNYGPLVGVPPNTGINLAIAHAGQNSQQQYSLTESSVGGQSRSQTWAFTDTRQLGPHLTQSENFSLSNSQSSFGGITSSNGSSNFTSLTHLTTPGEDYLLTIDKTFSAQPYGDNKLPELQVHPYSFFPHFWFPIQPSFTVGNYSEIQQYFTTSNTSGGKDFSTSRADLGFLFGPALVKVFGSDFSAQVSVNQYLYGTGDLKASILQTMSLNTPISNHIVNSITYNESNFNGPALVPFEYLDQQPLINQKGAQDLIRFYNGNVYNFTMGFATNFNGQAQPVTYQLNAMPSTRSEVILGGAFDPGPGQGFTPTTVQFVTPFGYETTLQFASQIDWQNHERLENKVIYLSKIIGECYEIQVQYAEAARLLNVSISLLAFPTRSAGFGIGQPSTIVPSSLNF
jgi:hypothetical protein